MRQNSPSVVRHLKAISLLDCAIALKAKHEDEAKPDPRYLQEKATHILLLNADWIPEDNDEFPHPDYALELLDRAYEICVNESVLQVQIVCNRLFYFIEMGLLDKFEDRAQKDYFELINLQKIIEPDNSKWPPFIIDMIAWARWNLFVSDDWEKRAITTQLQQTVHRSRGKEKERYEQHLKAVQQGIRRQNWIATRSKHRL
jgi:hypothetical protein